MYLLGLLTVNRWQKLKRTDGTAQSTFSSLFIRPKGHIVLWSPASVRALPGEKFPWNLLKVPCTNVRGVFGHI